ncbi:hypothetical protein PR048_013387 [Dryococelus australis]|uniref:Uncharacterized protein n=1 Tax=Dryococelus australis TaxID=614101 RepID=A0ABQ9HS34_9NEOP|nr:hypothetical protein PR048_013387 [Dryococelus australis]
MSKTVFSTQDSCPGPNSNSYVAVIKIQIFSTLTRNSWYQIIRILNVTMTIWLWREKKKTPIEITHPGD